MTNQEMNEYLLEASKMQRVRISKLLQGDVLYYPGSLFDGQPIKMANENGLCNVFIYADYGVRKEEARRELMNGLRGYSLTLLQEDDFGKRKMRYPFHFQKVGRYEEGNNPFNKCDDSILTAVYCKNKDPEIVKGADFVAVIYVCGDAFEVFDYFFVSARAKCKLLVLQDHGFGGNYSHFGYGGILHQLARFAHRYPQYILCATMNTRIWDGYEMMKEYPPQRGGMHRMERYMFQRVKQEPNKPGLLLLMKDLEREGK